MHKITALLLILINVSMQPSQAPIPASSSSSQAGSNNPIWQFAQTHGTVGNCQKFKTYTITDNQTGNFIKQTVFFYTDTKNEPDIKGSCYISNQEKFNAYIKLNLLLLDNKEYALRESIKSIITKRPDLTMLLPLTHGFSTDNNNEEGRTHTFKQSCDKTNKNEQAKTYTITCNQTGDFIEEKFIFSSNNSGEPDLELKHHISGNNDTQMYINYRILNNALCWHKETALRKAILQMVDTDPELHPLIQLTDGLNVNTSSIIKIEKQNSQ